MQGGSIPVRNVWHMLLYAWDLPRFSGEETIDLDSSPNLATLLARVLSYAAAGLLRRGLHRDFRDIEDRLRFLRGRVDLLGSARRLELIHGSATCVYDELSEDVLPNRILRTSLLHLARRADLPSEEAHRLKVLAGRLAHVAVLPSVTGDQFSLVRIGRNNGVYRMLMEVCRLVWRLRLPTEEAGASRFAGLLEDELTMSRVFETFVRNFMALRFPSWDVRSEQLDWPVEGPARHLPGMRTDISLMSASRRIVIDTKYYRETLREHRGATMVHSGNLYQMFAYLRTQEHRGHLYRTADGILLYPTAGYDVDELYRIQGHGIRVVTVDLASEWTRIETFLASLVTANPESATACGAPPL